MSRVRRPAAAYFLSRRFRHSQDDENIEMGLIGAAADDSEDPRTHLIKGLCLGSGPLGQGTGGDCPHLSCRKITFNTSGLSLREGA